MSGQEQTVIAFHAIGLDGSSFQPLAKALPAGWNLIGVNLDNNAHDLDGFVDAATASVFKIANDTRIHILGHSFGGVVAARVAERLQDQCVSLALLATPSVGGSLYLDRGRTMLREGVAATVHGTLLRWFGEEPPAHWLPIVEQTRTILEQQDDIRVANMWHALGAFEGFELLPLVCETLCLAAQDDRSTPPSTMRTIAQELSASGTAVTFETLPCGGHLFPMTEPLATVALLHHFWVHANRGFLQ